MARRRRHLAVALVVLAGSVGGSTAYAAWSATTSTPSSTFTSKPDWVAPIVGTNTIVKGNATGKIGYFGGYVKAGNSFWVYANVNESGNPASGFNATNPVTANLTNLGASATGALASGSCSSEGVTYNWCGGPFTVLAGTTEGTKTYTFTTKDQVPNTATTATQSVVVDNTALAGTNVQTVNAGATAGKAETNDQIVFTFNDVIDPESVLTGWTGASTGITLRFANANPDRITFYNAANTTQIAQLGTLSLPTNAYVNAALNFTGSSMALDTTTKTITVTLGTASVPAGVTTGGGGAMSWTPTTLAPFMYDRAGNNMPAGAVAEGAPSADAEF